MAVDSTGNVKGKVRGLDQDAVHVHRSGQNEARHIRQDKNRGSSETEGPIDTVSVEVGRTIQETIDPAFFANERKSKVAQLKQLVESGKYNVSSEDIARSVADEIEQEIYYAKTANGNNSGE